MAKKDEVKKDWQKQSTAITNQRTPTDIKSMVEDIDKTVPDGEEFVKIMEEEENKRVAGEPVDEEPGEEPENPEDELEIPEDGEEFPEEEPVDYEPEEELEEEEEEPTPEPQKKLPPIEERYKEAGQEAMILNSKNKKILDTIEEAENLPEPSKEELEEYARQMGENYEDLDIFAQNMLKENLQNKKRFGKIFGLVAEEKQVAQWINTVQTFIEQEDTLQKYPDIEANSEEFIKYASKKSHVNVDLDTLVAGFMWKLSKQPTAPKKNVLLPRSKGGQGQPQPKKPVALTEDDAKRIRSKDPKRYKQLIKAGKFKPTV